MAFMALFGWILLPLIPIALMLVALEAVVVWVMTHIFLINIIAAVLLVLNLLILIFLLRTKARRKREGVKKYRWLLPIAALWEGWVVLLCGLYLVIQPLRYIPLEKLPVDIGRDYTYSQELFYGTWTVTACQGKTPDCALTQEEIDRCVGWQITYSADRFASPGGEYPLEPSYAYQRDVVGKDDVSSRYGIELEELGIYNRRKLDYVHLFLPEETFWDTPLGKEYYIWNQNTILIYRGGVFFRAEREMETPS